MLVVRIECEGRKAFEEGGLECSFVDGDLSCLSGEHVPYCDVVGSLECFWFRARCVRSLRGFDEVEFFRQALGFERLVTREIFSRFGAADSCSLSPK